MGSGKGGCGSGMGGRGSKKNWVANGVRYESERGNYNGGELMGASDDLIEIYARSIARSH